MRAARPGRVVLAAVLLVRAVTVATPVQRTAVGRVVPPRFDAGTFDPLVEAGIRGGAYPGGAVVIGRHDRVLYARGYGRLTWSRSSPSVVPDSTVYDLASLTKVLATTTALMLLVERGQVRLDAPVTTYVPEFNGAGTASITVRELLAHTSGLRADLPDDEVTAIPDGPTLLARVLAETPRFAPGTRVLYSDLNAILLGEIVRRVAGEPLAAFVAREVLAPLELAQTGFTPAASWRGRIAPTGVWRGHPVAGVVNDPSAAKLGGAAGNAGLFATATDVARFAQFMLRQGTRSDGRRLVAAETVRLFTTPAAHFGRTREARALGWQGLPTGERVSSAGTEFGPRSYGHTGWTGTSLWIDPDRDLFVVLLTNRAFAPRARRSFTVLKEVRGQVADAAARASDAP